MSLPISFANETNPVMSELDTNFAALGAISYVPCGASGTNVIILTPRAGAPSVNGYSQLQGYSFVAAGNNSGTVQAQVLASSGSPLTLLNCYKPTANGPAALVQGDIRQTEYYVFIYDTALNSGAGGFHALNIAGNITSNAAPNTVYAGPTSSTPSPPSFRSLVGADLPLPQPLVIGGVMALNSSVSQFVNGIASSGQPQTAQVFFSNLGGAIAIGQFPMVGTTPGSLLIGTGGSGFALNTLTPGNNITIQNGDGTITISATGSAAAVSGPPSAIPGNVTLFSGATGGLISDSLVSMNNVGKLNATLTWSSGQVGAVTSLSGLGSVDINFRKSPNFAIAATSGVVLSGIFNASFNQTSLLFFTNGSSGNCALSFPPNIHWKFAGGSSQAPTSSTTANAIDLYGLSTLSSASVLVTQIAKNIL